MVAYSFRKPFVAPIQSYMKRQTIRAPRKRHARPGEAIQLYSGMRTKHCTKIIPDPVCTFVRPITIFFIGNVIDRIFVDNDEVADLDAFAILDGFVDADDMAAFWRKEHGEDGRIDRFVGYLIEWEPRANAERLAA